jgi:hypothetical protein
MNQQRYLALVGTQQRHLLAAALHREPGTVREHGTAIAWAQAARPDALPRCRTVLSENGVIVLGDFATVTEAKEVARTYLEAEMKQWP